MTKKPDWHPADIKAAIQKSGATMTMLAKRAGLSESACRNSLRKATPRADKAIADQIGVSLHVIWPSRYTEADSRLGPVRDQSNHEREGLHGLSQGAR